MARIGDTVYNQESDIPLIFKNMSREFRNLIVEENIASGLTLFPNKTVLTYATKEHGGIEQIQDVNGKWYGLDHGGYNCKWGFSKN